MNRAPFTAQDLAELDERLLARAGRVVAMEDIHDGATDTDTVGLRHDVDDNPGSFEAARNIASWEADRGYRATYFVLHTAAYWTQPGFRAGLEEIAWHGHEIGLHANAIARALQVGGDPDAILEQALDTLRVWGFQVRGVAAHGDQVCHEAGFVNDEQFLDCVRPEMGSATRKLWWRNHSVTLRPRPLTDFGLDYDTYRLPRRLYLSDSGGAWSDPFGEMCDRFPDPAGQLHMLWHPDWWTDAFPVAVAA